MDNKLMQGLLITSCVLLAFAIVLTLVEVSRYKDSGTSARQAVAAPAPRPTGPPPAEAEAEPEAEEEAAPAEEAEAPEA